MASAFGKLVRGIAAVLVVAAASLGTTPVFAAGPTITSISPADGPLAGGTSVLITGSNFIGTTGAAGVRFGATNATTYTVHSNSTITATAPPGASGTVDITVTNGTTSTISAADQFTYVSAPSVTSISPTQGIGGTSVVITGNNLSGATAVRFGATAATFTVNSATKITATAPAGAGTVDVTVTTAGGASATSAADQFTYPLPPAISAISPTSGPAAGGTTVSIFGTDFTGATAVSFGSTAAASFTIISPTVIAAVSPPGTGTVPINVTTAAGVSGPSAGSSFTYIPAPTVTGVSPNKGSTNGFNSLLITGTDFTGVTAVMFGGTASSSVILLSSTLISVLAPDGPLGTVDVTVVTPGGTSAISAADQFTRVAQPTITSISPATGPPHGGTPVIITGTDFSNVTSVQFGGVQASYNVNTATQITAVSPFRTSASEVFVTVTTLGGTTTTSASTKFTYVDAPTVTVVSPASGGVGTSVSIIGTDFLTATAVTFGATAATSFSIFGPNQITATAPAGTGTVDIRVTNPLGTSTTSTADQYTYIPPPVVTSISPTTGPVAGGTTVAITGTNLTGVTAVTFGATPAASFTVNSATSIIATSPAGTGVVDVTVTAPGGTSATLAADQFTYIARPTISSVSPAAGPLGGGTSVIITGADFSGATSVHFGLTLAPSFTVDLATQITATAPAGTGTVDVRVITPIGGTSAISPTDQFTYVAAPTVTSISPTSGPGGGGATVTITGTGFSTATAVTFGATAASSFTISSSTQIIATSPPGTGTVDIRVTNPGGTSATSAADQYTNIPPPTVTSISPTAGPSAGGTTVTITGTNFTGVTTVTFGATAATSFTVNSATSITATAPAGFGVVDIKVTTPGGTSATSAADQFTFVSPPAISSISPTAGPTGGGTTVIITGTSLSAATAVAFGATAATAFTVNSATQITATSPPGTGTVDVRVTTPLGGTSAVSAADQFTYVVAPAVTSIAPTSGPGNGGTSVTITGTGLSTATAVTFGGIAASSFTVNSSTQLTATSPAGAGTVDIRVTNPGGISATSAADQFTYIPSPTVTSISPTSGPVVGATTVAITGTNFTGVTAVTFGATAATSFTVNSATSITATAPAGAGVVDIKVTTASGGTSATSAADQFTYVAPPVISSISPTAGPTGGGTTVIITGTGLSAATAVVFGATAATGFTVNSATQITATSPAGTGTVDVRVTTPIGGTSAVSAADQFTYVAAPAVTSMSPTSGPGGGGTTVTIIGTGFSTASAVTFGAIAASGFTISSSTQIIATSPAGTGTVDIHVTNPGGTSATSAADQFTYIPAPAVTSISPSFGPAAGSTTVTITGSNFTGATAVAFGATPASFTVNSATQITATSPAGTGTVDVRVTTSGGTSATSAADQFTYFGTPTLTSISPNGGPFAGGTSVTLTGTNFTGATVVKFGAASAASFTVNSSTSITATSPFGTGSVDVTVTTPGGMTAISAADRFTYAASPAVTAVAPNTGPATGGTSVAITGFAFSGASVVKFGAANAASFTVNSATSITAVSPAGAGIVDVTVTTAGGTSPASASDQFSFTPAPSVSSISPASGPGPGGTVVTITGTGFTAAIAVKFGANNAASFTVNSASSITAISPPGAGTVDVTVTTIGGTSSLSGADRFAYLSSTTTTSLASSRNPSSFGQSVTFTATVGSTGGTPAGTVTFSDGGAPIGTSTLSAGVATFATTVLAVGNHTITASYGGGPAFNASTSPALNQSVDIPADSARLHALQVNTTKLVAQTSGQAISGAVDTAISEGFSDGGAYITPGAGGVRVNFAAAPDGYDDKPQSGAQGPNAYAGGGSSGSIARSSSRIDDAFAAIDRAAPTKAPVARFRQQKDWLFWMDMRGSGIDRWGTPGNIGQGAPQATLFGQQINVLSGLTYRARADLLIGVVGGYETFNYTETDINGKLRGDGWTVGAYLGWKIIPTLRYDATVTFSGIGYDGTAGTAHGNFNGNRWMFATGFTGSHSWANFNFEPSAKVYALWERENAYVDSLGTQQAARTFSSGRASAGNKVVYPLAWLDNVLLTPYVGVYADYYFTQDDAAAIVAAGGIPLASTPLLQGWSARATGGVGARLAGGATVGFGAELGGIGGNTRIWTFTGRARVPF
ncbi:IPT/TIG domain-containing protein [Bradyrhizobium diazoefficiens]|nr:IPT/TIG domain-containing protein [Bradyrhizobium diazoefficiens]MBR0848152.1 IPT/TIG domain-containing protein [Bradyrhizobium diazoefficiens]